MVNTIEHIRLRDIEREFARVPTDTEALEAREGIINGTLPDVPGVDSSEFEQVPLDSYPTDADFGNQLGQILGPADNVYVMSEEESVSPYGLTQFDLDTIRNRVVPYLREWGQLTTYWLMNPDTKRVVTLDKSGVVYWKRNATEPTQAVVLPKPH